MEAIKAELAALRTRVAQLETKLEAETSKRILLEEEVAKLKDTQSQSQPSTSFKKGSFMRVEKKRSDTDTQDLSSNSSSPRSSGGSPRGENGHEELSSSFGNSHISSNNTSNTASNTNKKTYADGTERSGNDRKTEWVKAPLRTSEPTITPAKSEEDKVLFDTVEHRTVREGQLEKMGGTRPSWKARWFRLQPGSMFYYKQQKDKKPIGEIVLTNCSVFRSNSKRPFEFTIKVPDRDWLLVGKDEDEANQWVEAIKTCSSKSSITYV